MHNIYDWVQLATYVLILAITAKPLGLYLVKVLDSEAKTGLEKIFGPVERLFYRLFKAKALKPQAWQAYSISVLVFSLVTFLFTYALLRLQGWLPLNPQRFSNLTPDLAFNTAVSFGTNTNWQSYTGEATMSYLSQMLALASHNFFSAAVGIAVAAALVRGIAGNSVKTLGNFWKDLVRINLYLLLPFCLVFAVFLLTQGMIQNFSGYSVAQTIDSMHSGSAALQQTIGQGPVASQVAIKMLGTNGGGFFNANAAHPFENPTPLSNFIQMISIFLIPSALTYYLGRMVKNQKHGWTIWGVMTALFLTGVLVCWGAEAHGNSHYAALGIQSDVGNMEGKEARFGVFNSALFATITTDASCGAVNSMHDSFTPLGGLVPLFNMQLGEVVFGGVGAGLYGMLVYVILAVFVAGLMVGRTPEYLGKKVGAYEIKAAVVAILIPAFVILFFSAAAAVTRWGTGTLNNSGPHGLSEILYAFSSAAANNGSAFAGLGANNPWWNTTLGIAMFLGRFGVIIPVMILAGGLAHKKIAPEGLGTFPVSGFTFAILLLGTLLIIGGLTFLPVLALSPIVEHFLLSSTQLF